MRHSIIGSFILVLIAGCAIDDADRCLEGYEWKQNMCMQITDSNDDDAEDTTPPAQTDPEENGVGILCQSDNDCRDYDADWCLKDPTRPADPGMCSVQYCTPEDCGDSGNYACCDCSANPLIPFEAPFCAPDDQITTLTSLSCICEYQ